jgi:hypothetical protein
MATAASKRHVTHVHGAFPSVPAILARRWCVTRSVTRVASISGGPSGAREAAAPAPQGAGALPCCSGASRWRLQLTNPSQQFQRPPSHFGPLAAWSRPSQKPGGGLPGGRFRNRAQQHGGVRFCRAPHEPWRNSTAACACTEHRGSLDTTGAPALLHNSAGARAFIERRASQRAAARWRALLQSAVAARMIPKLSFWSIPKTQTFAFVCDTRIRKFRPIKNHQKLPTGRRFFGKQLAN